MRAWVSRRRARAASSGQACKIKAHVPHLVFCAFLILVILGGGASRNDAASQPWIWIAAILSICAFALQSTKADFERVRLPLVFCGACAGLLLLQLIPLPPQIWTILPGRTLYENIGNLAGIVQPWRPISIRPQATVASLLSLTVPVAIIIGFSRIGQRWLGRALPLIVGMAFCSAVLGLAQLGGGSGGALRLYTVTNADYAVGLFANRNHQALLLVCALPLAPVAAKLLISDPASPARTWVSVGAWMLLVPMILLTGSRAGVLLSAPAIGVGLIMMVSPMNGEFVRRKHKTKPVWKWVPVAIVILLIAVSWAFSRSVALDRLMATDAQGELRTRLWQSLLDTATAFFPFGSGLGTFDPVYRRFEPFELLRPDYTNMAHNDILQLAIEAGLPGMMLAVLFVGWFLATTAAAWKRGSLVDVRLIAARCGSVIIGCTFLASIVDYPLRTPLLAAVFTIAALWLNDWSRRNRTRGHPPGEV
jgi:O-antigen ligase